MVTNNFCNEDGKIWVFDKTTNKIYLTKPINLFVEKDLYTYQKLSPPTVEEPHIKITKEYKYEKELSSLESKSASIFKHIISQARLRKTPKLSLPDRSIVKQFIITLARRTKESQERVHPKINAEDIFYKITTNGIKDICLELPDKETFYKNKDIKKLKDIIISNTSARFAFGDRQYDKNQEEKFIQDTGLMIVAIHNPRRSFVIGSHGITRIRDLNNNESTGVPISHDVMIVVTNKPDEEQFLTISDKVIRMINNCTFMQSNIVASRSKDLLESLRRAVHSRVSKKKR